MSNKGSYLQQLLNKRLGIQEDFIEQKRNLAYQQNIKNKLDPPTEPPAEIPVVSPVVSPAVPPAVPPAEIPAVPIKIKNERGAGRKKMNEMEKEKRKQLIIKKLSNSKEDGDIELISDIKNNSNKEEIQQEINKTKKRLQLLKESVLFID